MKRTLIIALAAAALITGCNRNEVIERNPEGMISFENPFIDAETRSGELTNTNFAKFYVSGTIHTTEKKEFAKVFDNQEVTKGDAGWSYTPPKFWFSGDYQFYAFSHQDAQNAVAAFPQDASTFTSDYKIVYNNEGYAGNEDLIVSKASVMSATEKYNTPVNLTFSHALARVKFSFANKLDNELYTIKIKNISTNEFIAKADYTFSTAAWTNSIGTFAPAFTTTDGIAQNGKAISTNLIYLIPDQATSITFTAEIYNDGKLVQEKTFTSTLNTQLLKATSYNFTAEIDRTALELNQINFNAEVSPWGEDQEVPVTVPQN